MAFPPAHPIAEFASEALDGRFQLHPRYRNDRPLDATLLKVEPGFDAFITEKYASQIEAILSEWSRSLLRSPHDAEVIAKILAAGFSGTSVQPTNSQIVRPAPPVEVRRNDLSTALVAADAFLRDLRVYLQRFSRIVTAEFQITAIDAGPDATTASSKPASIKTRVRYEIVGAGPTFHREQRIGNCDLTWISDDSGALRLQNWRAVDEMQATARSPVFTDVTTSFFARASSYSEQLSHGSDYWRTVIDGACGIDIYGHNGVSVADIDNDGFDDLYICQPAGLPNRLYRNRGDGTFEDITESSGLGILENTACALFADFDNDGRQDVIVVRAGGPLLFLNEGGGKFRARPDAFHFANPPQGTFTGAAVADYDRDGWLDIYFCLYAYYQGTGQYKYPLPYHAAENGPPNFLMRNNRDGTFRDVTAASGLDKNNTRYSFCCAWSDYGRTEWPDLYVVNDFGRKNLYRNNGDGTFTDVAHDAAVEDVGAGMSVGWLDYDNDGLEDLYVANMWTAAGERIATQPVFKPESPKGIRGMYQKHAMGNSLLRNQGASFEDATLSSGTGMGRWSWSSDALDFDHDGFADIYVSNGMISGPSRKDLNSFFWRQVVAASPDEARASKEYEQGWGAINELIRADGTWSGYERNVFYANNRDGTFSDVSAAVGLDFVEDGRSFALADFDHDGRIEIVLKNRNAPVVRVLKNVIADLPPSISFRLEGTKSNRDAVGAVVTLEYGSKSQTRTLRAGSGFLSQHSKDVFFGLGVTRGSARASIRWPSGLVQELHDLPANHRIWVKEGAEPWRVEPFNKVAIPSTVSANDPDRSSPPQGESLPTTVETWLLVPVAAPDFSLPDSSGRTQTLLALRGKRVLLHFSTAQSQECQADLETLHRFHQRWASAGLQVLAFNVDAVANPGSKNPRPLPGRSFSFPVISASEDVIAVYNILYRQLFDRHRDLILPTTFLIDSNGMIVKVYQGTLNPDHVEQDVRGIPTTDAERLIRGLPFASAKSTLEVGRNYLSLGAQFFQRGYLDQAEAAFQQAVQDDPSSAEALYGVGSVYLNQNRNAEARAVFARTVTLTAGYPETLPDAWNNLGVIATREDQMDEAIGHFQKALELNPHHLAALDNLGNAYRLQKRWPDARKILERALAVSPRDAEANYSLGMVYAQTGDNAKAYEFLQRALRSRPDYPEALNNLGVLYLVTQRRDDAVASFQKCIQVASGFDQAYLNLARVYELEGSHARARSVLLDLLKQHPEHAQAKQMLDLLDK